MKPEQFLLLILGVLLGVGIGYLIAKIFFLQKLKKQRQHAINQSKSVILGAVSEKIAPLLPQFPYEIKDCMFLGKGVDYIVFDGLSRGNLQKIVFVEIKTGKSQLNGNEKMIKSVIDNRFVKYEVIRL